MNKNYALHIWGCIFLLLSLLAFSSSGNLGAIPFVLDSNPPVVQSAISSPSIINVGEEVI